MEINDYEKHTGILVKLKVAIFQEAKINHIGYYFCMMLESSGTV